MKRLLAIMTSVLILCTVTACGVSQEDYDALAKEKAELLAQVESLEADNSNLKAEFETLKSENETLSKKNDELKAVSDENIKELSTQKTAFEDAAYMLGLNKSYIVDQTFEVVDENVLRESNIYCDLDNHYQCKEILVFKTYNVVTIATYILATIKGIENDPSGLANAGATAYTVVFKYTPDTVMAVYTIRFDNGTTSSNLAFTEAGGEVKTLWDTYHS